MYSRVNDPFSQNTTGGSLMDSGYEVIFRLGKYFIGKDRDLFLERENINGSYSVVIRL